MADTVNTQNESGEYEAPAVRSAKLRTSQCD